MSGHIPGCAILFRSPCLLRKRTALTPEGRHLEKRGRLVLAALRTQTTEVVFGSIYMPSGWSESVKQERRATLLDLAQELSAYSDAPVLVGGDWNCQPDVNPVIPLMQAQGWEFPAVVSEGQAYTYTWQGGQSVLDYWIRRQNSCCCLYSKHCAYLYSALDCFFEHPVRG